MKKSTLLFLIKRSKTTPGKPGAGSAITDICLAMKKRSFGAGRWNGVGGKVAPGETVRDAAIRETREEIGVAVHDLKAIAQLAFIFSKNPSWNQTMYAYFCETWDGVPTESEEMRPQWFSVNALPFSEMWPDDIFWIPPVLAGKLIKGSFTFGEGDVIEAQNVTEVSALDPE